MITNQIIMKKIIATRKSYPETDAKIIQHYDAAFTSGIVFKKDGTVDLYSGLCDMYEGKKVIENPFKGYISEDCIIENL